MEKIDGNIDNTRHFGRNFGELLSDDICFCQNSKVWLLSMSDGNGSMTENSGTV